MKALIETGIQFLGALLLAPLLASYIKKVKARLQGRRGPGLCQGYRDLWKYFRKETVLSEHASWISKVAPFVVFMAIGAVPFLLPFARPQVLWGFSGDFIAIVYLFGLARFFLALMALDSGSAFGGMGASREMAISALAEPALALALFSAAIAAGSTEPAKIAYYGLTAGWVTPKWFLTAVGLFIVILAETGRIPVDNPDTHLELTMIHEGMLLETSGRSLAFVSWAAMIKQLLLFTLLANLFFPWGLDLSGTLIGFVAAMAVWMLKLAVIGSLVAFVEASFAKMRLFKVPSLLAFSFIISLLGMTMALLGRG